MHFHDFHEVGGRHFLTFTDEGKRQVMEITAEERRVIGRNRARAHSIGFQSGRRGDWVYSPPFRCGLMSEEWLRGYEDGLRERRRRM
jgi:hypothetical protein